MPKFSANLSMLFHEVDFMDRFSAAAASGFQAVECQFPYGHDAALLAEQLHSHKLTMVLHNLPPGDWDAGERGIACHPDRRAEFRAGVQLAIDYATALGCKQLNCLAGITPKGVTQETANATLLDNLRYAAHALQQVDIRLLIEPINNYDIPGFHLNTTQQAMELIRASDCTNLFLQYDVYHAQRTEGELATTIAVCLPHIAHIQVADNPGRHEPGSGEINYPWLFRHIDRLGYDGWIGCEYRPATTTQAGLAWLHAARAA
ncbi:MAG: hydroxypyruvate isomerase [Burkholderiaceae bacterium]|nr:hydroxypyruvate isomerase [Burkholderiaceae bacterium]